VRSQIGQRVPLRLTPEVRFEYDDSIEEEELVQQVGGGFDRV
jgi:ribosome-binding factor A